MKLASLFLLASVTAIALSGCGKVVYSAGPLANNSNNAAGGTGALPAPACTLSSTNTPVVTSLPAGVTSQMISSVCPAIGQDKQCGIVIIVTDSGSFLYFTGQGPYDGSDDTLVGLLDVSSSPVSVLSLNSNVDIMGFDGDGIAPNAGGNALDATGYGGPNSYFSDISNGATSGAVHFITPVAAGGGSSYFALENALTPSTSCLSTLPQ